MKTPQTDDLARGNHVVPTEWAEQLERERDEARDMVENLTDHGLTLMDSNRMLKRERDEAREERDNLKQELEIVTARLHGKKHPLDNGIPERREIYIWKNGKYELDP